MYQVIARSEAMLLTYLLTYLHSESGFISILKKGYPKHEALYFYVGILCEPNFDIINLGQCYW